MSRTIQVSVVSAEEAIFNGKASFVALPGVMGELGVFPRHAPLITSIEPGEVRITLEDGTVEMVFVAGGILEIQPHMVTVLADTAVRAKDLDEAKLNIARQEAAKVLADAKSAEEAATAKAELAIMLAEIKAARKLKKRRN